MSISEKAIENGQKITNQNIIDDLKNGDWDCLYFAKEDQIYNLIDCGKIDEDFGSRYEDYQEELRCMKAEF